MASNSDTQNAKQVSGIDSNPPDVTLQPAAGNDSTEPKNPAIAAKPVSEKTINTSKFPSNRDPISIPLEIDLLRSEKGGDPEMVRNNERNRGKDPGRVDKIIELDKQWRSLRYYGDNWNRVKKVVSSQIGVLMKNKGPIGTENDAVPDSIIAMLAELTSEGLKELNVSQLKKIISIIQDNNENNKKQLVICEDKLGLLFSELGNILHPDVVISNDELDNKLITTYGDASTHKARSHIDLIDMIDGVDLHRGTKVSGSRCYYLKNAAVFLEQALIQLSLHTLVKSGFEILVTPFFMKKEVMQEVAQLNQFDEELYKVIGRRSELNEDTELEEKYLIATSEQTIAAYHRNEWMCTHMIPKRYAGLSHCFRQEVGAHGRDTRGIFRVHQFQKIEQFCITAPDKSWDMFREMMGHAEKFYQILEIPYQVVSIVSGELNNAAAMKYDLEGWFPGSQKFRELVSCSNCTDWQSRRLKIRYGQTKKMNENAVFVHMLNATCCATTRVICAILENYQTDSGIVVPTALRQYMPDKYKEFIPYVKFISISSTEDTTGQSEKSKTTQNNKQT